MTEYMKRVHRWTVLEMDQHARMEQILSAVSYKPGYSFRIVDPESPYTRDIVMVRLSAELPDASNSGIATTFVTFTTNFSYRVLVTISDEEIVHGLLMNMVRNFESHEMTEWFKYKGQYVTDPHPKN